MGWRLGVLAGRTAVFTIGHSATPISEFIGTPRDAKVEAQVDVRTVPRSRRDPWSSPGPLRTSLLVSGIEYAGMQGLGGLRRPDPNPTNFVWRNTSFRGFADCMPTTEFAKSLGDLARRAREPATDVMCGEAVPWRCHRSHIADAVEARDFDVLHIFGEAPPRRHSITSPAEISGTSVTYPSP